MPVLKDDTPLGWPVDPAEKRMAAGVPLGTGRTVNGVYSNMSRFWLWRKNRPLRENVNAVSNPGDCRISGLASARRKKRKFRPGLVFNIPHTLGSRMGIDRDRQTPGSAHLPRKR